jgi:hypothetical protein
VEEVELGPLLLAEDRPERARHPGDRRQRDQEQVEPVDAELVADAELRDPLVVGHVLEPAPPRVEVGEHDHHVSEHAHGRGEDEPAHGTLRQQRAHERRRQREEEHDREVDGHVELEIRK